jgi:hypothetical protein
MTYSEAKAAATEPSSAIHNVMAKQNTDLLATTLLLLEMMRVALLAPPPLCDVGDYAASLSVKDLVKVLMVLFSYVSKNPPATVQYQRSNDGAGSSGSVGAFESSSTFDNNAGKWQRLYLTALDEEEHISVLCKVFMDNIELLGSVFALHFPPPPVRLLASLVSPAEE